MCCSCQSPSVCSFSCSEINDKNCMYVYLLFLSMFSSNSCLGPTTNLVVLLPQSDKINLDCYSIAASETHKFSEKNINQKCLQCFSYSPTLSCQSAVELCMCCNAPYTLLICYCKHLLISLFLPKYTLL